MTAHLLNIFFQIKFNYDSSDKILKVSFHSQCEEMRRQANNKRTRESPRNKKYY
jgi:hypothetical protein